MPCQSFGAAEAVGGGVLIQPARQGEEEDPAAQSFVVPVPNGIQLETRQRSHQEPGTAAETAEVCSKSCVGDCVGLNATLP